jgi:hypothetical protein
MVGGQAGFPGCEDVELEVVTHHQRVSRLDPEHFTDTLVGQRIGFADAE